MKHCRHLVADRAMRTYLVIVSTPSLAFPARFVEAEKLVSVQAFGSELAVQAFNKGVVSRLARGDVMPGHLLPIRPGQDRGRGQLGAIVRDNAAGPTTYGDDSVEFAPDPNARDRCVGYQRQLESWLYRMARPIDPHSMTLMISPLERGVS